jgi:hypothetical protein
MTQRTLRKTSSAANASTHQLGSKSCANVFFPSCEIVTACRTPTVGRVTANLKTVSHASPTNTTQHGCILICLTALEARFAVRLHVDVTNSHVKVANSHVKVANSHVKVANGAFTRAGTHVHLPAAACEGSLRARRAVE